MALPRHGKSSTPKAARGFLTLVQEEIKKNWMLFLMITPLLVYYLLFHYMVLYGAQIAFKNYIPAQGIAGSPWAGFVHFRSFFESRYFIRILSNTLQISFMVLVFGFPLPIIFALLLNEIRVKWYKRAVQTFSYLPHFISIMVVAGMIITFTARNGFINDIITFFGGTRQTWLQNPAAFKPIYVISDIWQSMGWSSIIYIAALTSIDVERYEAASIDGANRFQKVWYISIPGIMPAITTLLILRMGSIMSVGFEKIILLYNDATRETADVISSFVYRRGLMDFAYSYSSAVGLFNSLVNLILVFTANKLSKKITESGLF